jgi:hypothetical protein
MAATLRPGAFFKKINQKCFRNWKSLLCCSSLRCDHLNALCFTFVALIHSKGGN